MTPAAPIAIAALAAAGWTAQSRADRRRILADPAHRALSAPLEGRAVPVISRDGTRLHAEVFGPERAPTIVLLHGWTEALRFWTHQIRALSSELRVVAYDLRGHARSARAPSRDAYRIDDHADDLDAVLRELVPAGERAVVAGHSLGAMVLVAWAGDRPEQVADRLAGAALLNTGVGDLVSESLVVRAPGPLSAVQQAVGRAMLSARAPLPKGSSPVSHRLLRYVALSRSASPATVAFCERLVLDTRRDVRGACGATMSRLDLRHAVESLDVPTIVISGAHDRLTPPAHARRIAAVLPQLAGYVEIPGIGHMAAVEAPQIVTEQIAGLARATARGRERDADDAA